MTAIPDVTIDAFNAKVSAFMGIHRSTPSTAYAANLRTSVDVVHAGEVNFPVTVNDREPDNAWVCSPYTTYCLYGREEASRLHPFLSVPLKGLIGGAGSLLRRHQLDKAVAINNWLVSTNSYPRVADVDIDAAIDEARGRWPDHAIWFRSLNDVHHPEWLHALVRRGGKLLPSRQVYLFDEVPSLIGRHRDLHKDLRLLDRGEGVTCAPLAPQEADTARAAELYQALYIRKYSRLNPRYGTAFLHAWSASELLSMWGLRDADGTLQGVVGIFRIGNLLTSPVVGYNLDLPQKLGLYRRLAAIVLREAATHGLQVNLSAGVAHFKRQRGGRPAIEYSVVLADHLTRARRNAIALLGGALRGVGVPIMRSFQL